MSGLTTIQEMSRSGRTLIAKLMKGTTSSGISHIAMGKGTGVPYAQPTNPRTGNNFEMSGYDPVVVHSDFPVFNFTAVGLPNTWYTLASDKAMSFGPGNYGEKTLQGNMFNHLFAQHVGQVNPSLGLADIYNLPTLTAAQPTLPDETFLYIGYVECDGTVKTFHNPSRMFQEIGRVVGPQVEFLGERAINGRPTLESLQPELTDISNEPNPALLVRGVIHMGLPNDTVREIALLGDNGNDVLSWGRIVDTPVVTGQGVFVRWGIAF